MDGDTEEFGLAERLAADDCLLLHSANEAATVHINKACLPVAKVQQQGGERGQNVKSIHTARTTNSGKWQHSTKIRLSQFSQLCLLIKKTSLGTTQRARQIQTRCCKMARALSSQLPRDLKVLDISQETLSDFCGTTFIQTVICCPLKGEIVLKPRFLVCLHKTFREISAL